MKILLINDYQELIGGTETYLYTLKAELEKQGHLVECYFGSTDHRAAIQAKSTLSSFVQRIFNVQSYQNVRKIISHFKPDIIHLQNIFNEVSPSVILAAGKIPVILTIHDYQLIQAVSTPEARTGKQCNKRFCKGCVNCVGLKGTIFEKVKRIIHRPILSKVKVFLATSKFMQQTIRQNFDFDPHLLYLGIHLFPPAPLKNKNSILYSGRLEAGKGVEDLIEAFHLALHKVPKASLIIAGDGILRQSLEQKVMQLNLQDKVQFLGRVSSDKLFEYYQQSTVVVVPSTWPEPFGIVAVEALSVGRPVIATNVGGLPEIVKQDVNGLICSPKNPTELAAAITSLLGDETLVQKLAKNGPKSVQHFYFLNHLNNLVKVYSQIIESVNSRGN